MSDSYGLNRWGPQFTRISRNSEPDRRKGGVEDSKVTCDSPISNPAHIGVEGETCLIPAETNDDPDTRGKDPTSNACIAVNRACSKEPLLAIEFRNGRMPRQFCLG